jgi:hypothetical protein
VLKRAQACSSWWKGVLLGRWAWVWALRASGSCTSSTSYMVPYTAILSAGAVPPWRSQDGAARWPACHSDCYPGYMHGVPSLTSCDAHSAAVEQRQTTAHRQTRGRLLASSYRKKHPSPRRDRPQEDALHFALTGSHKRCPVAVCLAVPCSRPGLGGVDKQRTARPRQRSLVLACPSPRRSSPCPPSKVLVAWLLT